MSAYQFGDNPLNPFLIRLRQSRMVSEKELAAIGGLLATPRLAAGGSDMFAKDAVSTRLHVLLEGWAFRYKILANGGRKITAVLLPGDVCDLDTLYLGRSDTAVGTLTPCMVACLDRAALRSLAADNPGIAWGLGWLASVENAILAEHTVGLARRSALERTAHLFCELYQRLVATGHNRESGYTLPLTQSDISDVLGLSTVHVNRVLQMLRSERLIALQRREVVILDWPALCTTAEFQAGYLHLDAPEGSDAAAGLAVPAKTGGIRPGAPARPGPRPGDYRARPAGVGQLAEPVSPATPSYAWCRE